MAVVKNKDGSITVGIIKRERSKEKTAPKAESEKDKAE